MKLYNTVTRKKEEFVPREEGKVAMYVCGPTVYNHIHIGNARTFLSFDVIRRYLQWRGYDVTFVQNVTDVDDKIINKANEEGRSAAEVADEYTKAFIEATEAMGIKAPDVRPLATVEIPSMISLIERLIERGHAYESQGDVYFSVRSYPKYGQLSGRDIDDLISGARVEVDDRKRDPLDFALWKAAKPGEPSWDSPWGAGRPGWHIECSAMSEKFLGLPFDIHGGGSDLAFPHHENEAAQAEAAWDKPFSKYWMHGGMLNINQEKMSKSLGNFLLLKDVLDDGRDPNVLRLLMLQTHYRSPLDFSDARLDEAEASLERLATAVRNATWASEQAAPATDDEPQGGPSLGQSSLAKDAPCGNSLSHPLGALLREAAVATRDAFVREMDDDFNTAGALGAVFTLVSELNAFVGAHETNMTSDDVTAVREARDCIVELLGVLGISLGLDKGGEWPREIIELAVEIAGYDGEDTGEAVNALLDARAKARSDKDWATADAVRDGMAQLGFTIEDTPVGARVEYKAV